MPPEETFIVPPVNDVPLSVPPDDTLTVPPPPTVAWLSVPPEVTVHHAAIRNSGTRRGAAASEEC